MIIIILCVVKLLHRIVVGFHGEICAEKGVENG